jgi:DUF2975 family protein
LSVQQPSRAVRVGYALTNLLLVVSVGFAAFLFVDGAVGVARDGERLVSGRTLDVHVQVPPERVRLPDGLRHDGWLPAVARIEHPGSREIALWTALQLTQAVLFIAVLWLLRGLARSVRKGDPFDAANVQRLRGIGSLLVFGGLLVEILNSSIRAQLWETLPAGRFGNVGTEGFGLPGNMLLAGLGAFILAEVFAQGLRMREDLEGTV